MHENHVQGRKLPYDGRRQGDEIKEKTRRTITNRRGK